VEIKEFGIFFGQMAIAAVIIVSCIQMIVNLFCF